MKRLLLAQLFLTFIFGCSYKESVLDEKNNPNINLECTLDYVYSDGYQGPMTLWGPILITLEKDFNYVDVIHKERLGSSYEGKADLKFTTFGYDMKIIKDTIKFSHNYSFDDVEHTYEINRATGEILYTFVSKHSGKCIVLEDPEPLF